MPSLSTGTMSEKSPTHCTGSLVGVVTETEGLGDVDGLVFVLAEAGTADVALGYR